MQICGYQQAEKVDKSLERSWPGAHYLTIPAPQRPNDSDFALILLRNNLPT
jgi:hypothetical protein